MREGEVPRVLARADPNDGAAASMDRLQRRNPSSRTHSTSLMPPRPPRGPTFQTPPASRPIREPEPSFPDGRQRKRVRFANEASSHCIGGKQVANIREDAKNKPQVCDAKTAEYKFFKKLCEKSGQSSHSYKHSHQSFESNVSKQKQGSCNVTAPKKFYVHENTVYCDDPPATPAKNEEVPGEKIIMQSSHSEYGDKDTPQVSPHDRLMGINVLTPIAQTSFDVSGISGNVDREPISGQIFSEKRSNLLKIAAKTVSMGSAELFQRRSEFVHDILQRLGIDNIMRKQEGSMRHRKMDCRQALAIPKGHFDNLQDYKRSDFNSLAKLRTTGKMPSSYASDETCEFMALPWGYNQGPVDRKNDLSHVASEARECMALPWVCVNDTRSSDRKGDIYHSQVSNSLLEDVSPYVHDERRASANEFSLNAQTDSYDQHRWGPMLSVTLSKSFHDRLYFPCQNEEQHAVPFGISNTSEQPDLCSSIEQYTSSSVGLCGNSDAGFSTRLAQLVVKPTISSTLDTGSEILDHNDFRCISNFNASQSNNMFSSNSSCLDFMSTPEQSYKVGTKSLLDSSFGLSCLAGLEQYSTEEELPDNSDRLLQVLDQLPVKFIPSSFANDDSRSWDHQSSYVEPCKQDWGSLHDSTTELWSSVHLVQSHADSGAVLGFIPNGSAYSNLVERHHSLVSAQENLNNEILGTTDLSFFGSCLALDNITEAPMLSSDGITW